MRNIGFGTVPQTDKEVIDQFKEQYSDDLLKKNLIGIFQCRRGLGDDVATAYEYTLKAHIGENH